METKYKIGLGTILGVLLGLIFMWATDHGIPVLGWTPDPAPSASASPSPEPGPSPTEEPSTTTTTTSTTTTEPPTTTTSTTSTTSTTVAPTTTTSTTLAPTTTLAVKTGIPFGAYGVWASTSTLEPNTEMFNLSTDSNSPSEIAGRISAAKTKGIKIILTMTGGGHTNPKPGDLRSIDIKDSLGNITRSSAKRRLGCCMVLQPGAVFTAGADGILGDEGADHAQGTADDLPGSADDVFVSGVAVFDLVRWKATQDKFNTATIKAVVAQGVLDGVVIGANLLDEPNVTGSGDGNTWGPSGVPGGKATLDTMAAYTRAIFPTLPIGVAHRFDRFDTTHCYTKMDFQISQFSYRSGTPAQDRDGALGYSAKCGTKIMFSFNPVNGGVQDQDVVKNVTGAIWDCANEGGLKGQSSPNCAMTPAQIVESATTLGKASCGGQIFWKYDSVLNAMSGIKQAYVDAASVLKAAPNLCPELRR